MGYMNKYESYKQYGGKSVSVFPTMSNIKMSLSYAKELNVKYEHLEKKLQLIIRLMGQILKPEDNKRNEAKKAVGFVLVGTLGGWSVTGVIGTESLRCRWVVAMFFRGHFPQHCC